MADVPIPPERVQDPCERTARARRRPRPGAHADAVGRAPNAGFTAGRAVAAAAATLAVNVAAQRDDPRSMLSLHRALLALRREFVREPYETLAADDATLVFRRGAFVVALNLSGEPAERPPGELRLSTELDGGADALRPNEGVVLSR